MCRMHFSQYRASSASWDHQPIPGLVGQLGSPANTGPRRPAGITSQYRASSASWDHQPIPGLVGQLGSPANTGPRRPAGITSQYRASSASWDHQPIPGLVGQLGSPANTGPRRPAGITRRRGLLLHASWQSDGWPRVYTEQNHLFSTFYTSVLKGLDQYIYLSSQGEIRVGSKSGIS